MKDYLLFVDETKPDKYHPNFCFAGIVVEREYYEKIYNALSTKIYHIGTDYENILGIRNIL